MRFGVSAASAGLFVDATAKLEPTCDQTDPLKSYVRNDWLLESINATRFGESAASAGAPTVAIEVLADTSCHVRKRFDDVTDRRLHGVTVPIPTFPSLLTKNKFADEEPTTNAGAEPRNEVSTENFAHGVEVPTPTLPVTP